MKGGLSINSLSVEMDTGGLRDRESETVLGDPLLNVINTQLNGALKMLQQVSGLKHMDQSVIHHPLEGLTQAAREGNRLIVGRIRRIFPRGREARAKSGGSWGFSTWGKGRNLKSKGGHSIWEAEALGQLQVEESSQIEDYMGNSLF
ncbi:hypothetical protein PoB_003096800 [Plakobranchus ocellatus]|uniref:Uncharacterized protein n=1 Tax=Plakobranchus ocellatus TaxID=259542 RepID=A0AAV4AB51_9GAST|nr:hypothetical protein PoB_003096800 [Plakobranchus ocellatus]